MQNIQGHMLTVTCHSQHICLLWMFDFSSSPGRWKVLSLEGLSLGNHGLLINITHQNRRRVSTVQWYLYFYFFSVLFHLIIYIISMVSRKKTLYFIDPLREVNNAWLPTTKSATLHASFPLKKVTVARPTALPLASFIVFIFLSFGIQSLISP